MATELEVENAKSNLDELLKRAKGGEEILLVDRGVPVAKLVPADDNPRAQAFGMFKGRVWMSDDFDAPLTDEELREWGV